MSNRVVDCEVKEIKSVTFTTTPFITAANAVVNTINDQCGTSFTEAQLTQIELFLAAHFWAGLDVIYP